MTQKSKYWYISVYRGTETIYQKKVKFGQITEKSMQALLKTLVAKYGLDNEEIISSYAKQKTKLHHNFLPVEKNRNGAYGYSCGENPYAVAIVK